MGARAGREHFLHVAAYRQALREAPVVAASLLGQFERPRAEETVVILERLPCDAPVQDLRKVGAIVTPTLVLANRQDSVHLFAYRKTGTGDRRRPVRGDHAEGGQHGPSCRRRARQRSALPSRVWPVRGKDRRVEGHDKIRPWMPQLHRLGRRGRLQRAIGVGLRRCGAPAPPSAPDLAAPARRPP